MLRVLFSEYQVLFVPSRTSEGIINLIGENDIIRKVAKYKILQ